VLSQTDISECYFFLKFISRCRTLWLSFIETFLYLCNNQPICHRYESPGVETFWTLFTWVDSSLQSFISTRLNIVKMFLCRRQLEFNVISVKNSCLNFIAKNKIPGKKITPKIFNIKNYPLIFQHKRCPFFSILYFYPIFTRKKVSLFFSIKYSFRRRHPKFKIVPEKNNITSHRPVLKPACSNHWD
jgi:hypothetical protein